MDYNKERESNIIKNIAKDILMESAHYGLEVTTDLAQYLVRLKILNPRNGFTASEVMPRVLTQQLVTSVIEDLKQQTPAMNCIRMQVYWKSVQMTIPLLQKEYIAGLTEKAEPYLTELLNLDRENASKMSKLLGSYILVSQNLGSVSHPFALKETMAAFHSVLKNKDYNFYFNASEEQKLDIIKSHTNRVTGIRLYLKSVGKAGEGIEDIKSINWMIGLFKEDISKLSEKLSKRIEEIREVIMSIVPLDVAFEEVSDNVEVYLPPECDQNDLKYLKQVLTIMLQHSAYINDLMSKVDEIDGNANFILKEYYNLLNKLQETIQEREAIPTSEIYDDFDRLGEIWLEIQTYFYCLEAVEGISKRLEEINKKEHYQQSTLEKAVGAPLKRLKTERKESDLGGLPSAVALKDSEDFALEFSGFCAWTLYCGEGFLLPGDNSAGIYQYQDQYFAFSTPSACEKWGEKPRQYLMHTYEYLRYNPELIDLLNAYDNLYMIRTQQIVPKTKTKITTREVGAQTIMHPIDPYRDEKYTFSEWEMKKNALYLSRLIKCVTKSAQTNSNSHFQASIGITAAPSKDKEVQTKRDQSCGHPTISKYLYGLRGHKEDKFKVIELTRPIEESCVREIILEKDDSSTHLAKKKNIETVKIENPFTHYKDNSMCGFSNDNSYESINRSMYGG